MRFESNKNRVIDATRKGERKALESITLDLLNRSVRLAPKETGDLRGSGQAVIGNVTIAKGNDDGGTTRTGFRVATTERMTGTVGFGVPYALVQHEDLTYEHDDGQAKYLEQPATQNASKYKRFILDAIRNATR